MRKRLAQLTTGVASAGLATRQTELARMGRVAKNFAVHKAVEIVLLAAGVGCHTLVQHSDAAAGMGAGLALQSTLMRTLNLFAQARRPGLGQRALRL
ncbi:MAG TPA: hypothetical protein VEE84_08870 [Burkholderiaceae bacterium]|nr:hypothetical protein [Burkholderiaceae bacterium]